MNQSDRIRNITMHKNSDGILFSIKLELTDSLRLQRSFEAEGTEVEPNDGEPVVLTLERS